MSVQISLFGGEPEIKIRDTYKEFQVGFDQPESVLDIPSCPDCVHVKHTGEFLSGYSCSLLRKQVNYNGTCRGHEMRRKRR